MMLTEHFRVMDKMQSTCKIPSRRSLVAAGFSLFAATSSVSLWSPLVGCGKGEGRLSDVRLNRTRGKSLHVATESSRASQVSGIPLFFLRCCFDFVMELQNSALGRQEIRSGVQFGGFVVLLCKDILIWGLIFPDAIRGVLLGIDNTLDT